MRVEEANVRGLVEQQDLVVDCTDSFETRYLVNAACCAAGVPLVEGGVAGWSGLVMPIQPGETACYRCAFPTVPEGARSCAEAGVLGPAAGIVGSLQALEAIKLLTAAAPPLTDAFLQVDLLSLEVLRVQRPAAPRLPGLRRGVTCSTTVKRASAATSRRVPTSATPPRRASRRSASSPAGPGCTR